MRLLFWILIGALAVYVLRSAAGRGVASAPAAQRAAGSQNMVRCDACKLNLPESDAVAVDGRWACCEEHARQLRGPARSSS